MKNKLSDKGLENLLSIPKEEIEAEIERRTIGYKFKGEKEHFKFLQVFNILQPNTGCDIGSYRKETLYDITNRENNIFLLFAKEYNLLDELFTPVYKKEKKSLPMIAGYKGYVIKGFLHYGIADFDIRTLNSMHINGILSFKTQLFVEEVYVSKKKFKQIIDYIND